MTYTDPNHPERETERSVRMSQTNRGSSGNVALAVILAIIVVGAGIWLFSGSTYKATPPNSTSTPSADQTAPVNPPAKIAPATPATPPAQTAPATPPAQTTTPPATNP